MKQTIIKLSILLLALFFSACSSAHRIETQEVKYGYFTSKDYKIVAEDNSFEIKGGAPFTPPFYTKMYGCESCEKYYLNKVDLLLPKNLLLKGAKRVKVYRGDKMVYGLLALNKVFTNESESSSGSLASWKISNPSIHSYELMIPDKKFDATLEGKTELIFESFGYLNYKYSVTDKSRKALSWILLLSRTPL